MHWLLESGAEFNAYCDPEALQSTLALGVPVAMVPLDVCRKVLLCRSVVNSYKSISQTKLMQLIVTSHLRYIDHCNRNEGIDGCFPYDALAVLAATDLHGFHRLRGRVHVDCSKARRGETTFSPDPSSHIEILTGGRLKWAREKLRSLQF
jgi:inosine-uridine nucleoside N-ribohydrolase